MVFDTHLSWIVQEGATPESALRLAWRLEYERSTVFFAVDLAESGPSSGATALAGKAGDVFAAPRADPKAGLRKVGFFDAKRVSNEWDMREPTVARRVTEKALPER